MSVREVSTEQVLRCIQTGVLDPSVRYFSNRTAWYVGPYTPTEDASVGMCVRVFVGIA